ncbi:hypothetical protein GCM10007385_35680 [Tateyamaria omphalii]|uniref:thermonuclease family protein n=1 Tax=Tateyamaria omphalii TaxID=299262 RepID=UPI001677D3C9|nr:thermonuclease family protein [Tateyamaria omphalii]GGX63406.1 hypothetical protein GCM10007385_35680 [Tateyamaria omphalii]
MQWFILAPFLAVALPATASAQNWIEGRVTHVRDIDTIEVKDLPVRFNGIDGPELDTPAGAAGRKWLRRLVLRKPISCSLTGAKTHDRWVGTCYLPSGQDIGALAISEGLARDCPRYSRGKYREYETDRSRALPVSSYCR